MPCAKPVRVAVVAPVLHWYDRGGVSFWVVTVAVAERQVASVDTLACKGGKRSMLNRTVSSQPYTSVTVTAYCPAVRPVTEAVVAPLLHW